MNFLGIDVRGLDLDAFFRSGRVVYLAAYFAWLLFLVRGRRRAGVCGPVLLALVVWALTTFPLSRPYGLQVPSPRLHQLSSYATAAAGNPPWESGVLGRPSVEPFWSLIVSLFALRDPACVIAVDPFLPALAMVLTGVSLAWAFGSRARRGLFVSFFVLLASTQPVADLEPLQNAWARHFLLAPNHALGLALVPVFVRVLSVPLTGMRTMGAAALLGLLGWAFVVHWALLCASVGCFVLLAAARRTPVGRFDLVRLAAVLALSALLVAPFLFHLSQLFPATAPVAAGEVGAAPGQGHWRGGTGAPSLSFFVALDLGPQSLLALYGAWRAWRRGRRDDLLWLGLLATAWIAWAGTVFVSVPGLARAADEIHWFIVFAVAVHAGLGAHALVWRGAAALRRTARLSAASSWRRLAAAAFLLWYPFTIGGWWDPPRMDANFAAALEPVPAEMEALAVWLRGQTRGGDVVLAGGEVAAWVPVLSGRRVLRFEPGPQAAGVEPAVLRDRWGVKVIVWEIPAGAVRWTSELPKGQTLVRGVHRTERVTAYLLGP